MPLTLPPNPAASNPAYQNFSASASQENGSSSTSTAPWGGVKTPDWLTTDPNKLMGELSNQYSSLTGPNAFGMDKYAAAAGQSIRDTRTTGEQAATNAAESYANRLSQSGATAFATGTVKAQNLLGTESQVASMQADKQKTLLDSREKAASMASSVASTMAGLRSSYLGMLAGVTANIANNNRTTTTSGASTGLSGTVKPAAGTGAGGAGGNGGNANDFYSIIPNSAGKAGGITPVSYNSGTGGAYSPVGNLGGGY